MRVEVTTFKDSYEEALPLIEKHWDEVPFGKWKELGIEVNTQQYLNCEEAGFLRVIVARDDDDNMIGYVVIMPNEMNHHKGVWMATTDVIYVDPEYRGKGLAKMLMAKCMEECKKSGIAFFTVGVNPNCDFSPMCEKEGGTLTEKFYTWRI